MSFGEKPTEGGTLLVTPHQDVCATPKTIAGDVGLDHRLRRACQAFGLCSLSALSLPRCWECVTEPGPPPSRGVGGHREVPLGTLVSLPPPSTYSSTACGRADNRFALLFQLWLLERPRVPAHAPASVLTSPHFLAPQAAPLSSYMSPAPAVRKATALRSPGSLFCKVLPQTTSQAPRLFTAAGVTGLGPRMCT